MLLHNSRRETRVEESRDVVMLEQQNGTRWSKNTIIEDTTLLPAALKQGRARPYQIQAAISGVHAHSADSQSTDWAQIVALYGELLKFEPTSVVRLNQAIAMCMAGRPENALAALNDIENLQ